jgi:hypothetical protein
VGALQNTATEERRHLQSHTLVGRAPACALLLEGRLVSGEHAVITWHEDGWRVRDLGSRNGTFLNGDRIEPRVVYRCSLGTSLAFGDQQLVWKLVDASAPTPMLLPLNGGAACLMERGILLVPNAEEPMASIHQGAHGAWLLELPEHVQVIEDGALVQLSGRAWRFHAPDVWVPTESFGQHPLALETTQLCFRVSMDEETVELDLRCPAKLIPMGRRTAFYLLLTLARIRLEQRTSESQGWVHWSELATMLHAEQTEINLWVHRIRERFAEVGFARPGAIVERRSGTGQLRIGTDDIVIARM